MTAIPTGAGSDETANIHGQVHIHSKFHVATPNLQGLRRAELETLLVEINAMGPP